MCDDRVAHASWHDGCSQPTHTLAITSTPSLPPTLTPTYTQRPPVDDAVAVGVHNLKQRGRLGVQLVLQVRLRGGAGCA
jgi:hypothetical protein